MGAGACAATGIDAVALPLIGIAPPADPAAGDCRLGSPCATQARRLRQPERGRAVLGAAARQARSGRLACRPRRRGRAPRACCERLGVPAARIVEPAADAAQFDSEALWAAAARARLARRCGADRARRRRARVAGRHAARARCGGRLPERPTAAARPARRRASRPAGRRPGRARCAPVALQQLGGHRPPAALAPHAWHGRRPARWPRIRALRARRATRASARCTMPPRVDAVVACIQSIGPDPGRLRATVNAALPPPPNHARRSRRPAAPALPLPAVVVAAVTRRRGACLDRWWPRCLLVLSVLAVALAWQPTSACQPRAGTGAPPAGQRSARPPRPSVLAKQAQDRHARGGGQAGAARGARGRGGRAARAARGTDPDAVALARREPRGRHRRRAARGDAAGAHHRQRRAAGGHAEAGRRAPGALQPAAARRRAPRDRARPRPRQGGGRDRHRRADDQARRSGAHGRRAAAAVAGRAARKDRAPGRRRGAGSAAGRRQLRWRAAMPRSRQPPRHRRAARPGLRSPGSRAWDALSPSASGSKRGPSCG